MALFKDLTGKRFNHLLVISEAGRTANGNVKWLCKCDCGNDTIVASGNLKNSNTTSCGCNSSKHRLSKMSITHGQTIGGNTTEYIIWLRMKERCLKPKCPEYKYYGARGIKICDEWMDFSTFLRDMGFRPNGLTLERNENNGNYEKSNCRWASRKDQSRNKRNNHWLEYNGELHILQDWADILSVSCGAIDYHLRKGKSFSEIYNHFTKCRLKQNNF